MYQNIDKTQTFYYFDHKKEKHICIGDRKDFISYLSKFFSDTEYKDTARWEWSILADQNVTTNDMFVIEEECYLRPLTFYDGDYRIIDVRDFYEEAVAFYKSNQNCSYRRYFHFKRNHRKYHSGNHMRHKMPKTARIIRMDSAVEMKEFSRKSKKTLPRYYDDKARRVSCSWKDQKKYKKQWMHKINGRNCDSIRYYTEED